MKRKLVLFVMLAFLLLTTVSIVFAGNLYVHLSFDGIDDYVEVASDLSLNVGDEDFTIEMWFKILKADMAGELSYVFSWYTLENAEVYVQVYRYPIFPDPAYHSRIRIGLCDFDWDLAYIDYNNGNTDPWADPYFDDEWHHLCVTVNSTHGVLYLDRVVMTIDSEGTPLVGNLDTNTSVYIGGNFYEGFNFTGSLDEIRLYTRQISTAEISYSFTNKEPQNETNLVLWLRMDEGTGDTVYDETANNNDGTLMPNYPSNTPTWVDETPPPPTPPAPKPKHKPSAEGPLPPWVDPRNLSAVFLFALLLVYAYSQKTKF